MTGTLPEGWIIEHPTRGILFDLEHDGDEWRPRWSPTRGRDEARRFGSLPDVRMALSRIPDRQRRQLDVRRWGSWSKVNPTTGGPA